MNTRIYQFYQVDVFSDVPLLGNALAVVVDADDMTDEEMHRFARWTNLSETTFLLKPQDPQADYRVRIFTLDGELPFAGHPTLGSCHVWKQHTGFSETRDIIQECAAGLITLRQSEQGTAFAAPPMINERDLTEDECNTVASAYGIPAVPFCRQNILITAWHGQGLRWIPLPACWQSPWIMRCLASQGITRCIKSACVHGILRAVMPHLR